MSADPNIIPEGEFGRVRVFTTALDPEEASAITAKNVHKLLGDNVELNAAKVEVVPSGTLAGLGLTTYLIEGYGVAEEELAGRAAALDAVDGLLILIPSVAFGGKATTLDPNPSLRLLGTFREVAATPPAPMESFESAEGTLEPLETDPMPMPRTPHRSWIGAIGALLICWLA